METVNPAFNTSLLEFISPREEKAIRLKSPPSPQAVNHTTGETFPRAPGEPVFQIAVKPHAPDDRISVFCQRSRASLPRLIKGKNTVLLQAGDKRGTATLAAEIDALEKVVVP